MTLTRVVRESQAMQPDGLLPFWSRPMNSDLLALLTTTGPDRSTGSLDRRVVGPAHSLGPELRAWAGAKVPRPGLGVLE